MQREGSGHGGHRDGGGAKWLKGRSDLSRGHRPTLEPAAAQRSSAMLELSEPTQGISTAAPDAAGAFGREL